LGHPTQIPIYQQMKKKFRSKYLSRLEQTLDVELTRKSYIDVVYVETRSVLSAIGLPPLTTSRVIALSCNTNNIKRHRGSCRAAFISFDLMLFHFALYIWSDVTAKANNLDSLLCVSLFFFLLLFPSR
jgi:hypothetical protein